MSAKPASSPTSSASDLPKESITVATMDKDLEAERAASKHDGSAPLNHVSSAVTEKHQPGDPSSDSIADGIAAEKTKTGGTMEPGGALHPDSYPEGGMQAWLAVLGGFCCLFVSFGWINAIGIFQQEYQTNILRQYSPSTVAWIVSLETFVMFFGGPFMGLVFDNYGPRPLLLVGTFLHVFGLMMASVSTQYYQFILAQGFCSPIGASAVFYAALSSVVTWFHKRRGLALGVMASGSSLGGVILPIMVQNLIPRIGFPWAMRTVAFMILALLAVSNVTVKSRIAPRPRRFKPMALVAPMAEPTFGLMAVASFLIFFGLFIPFTFLQLQALTVGTDPELDQYIIPILNAVSIFGRITPGYVSDKVGRFNTTIVMCTLCGVLVLALWLPSAAPAPVIVFAALYGFGSGAFVSIIPALVATVSPDMRQIGTRNGTLFAIISIGALCGNPVAGAILSGSGGGYHHLQIFCGVMILAGTVLLTVVRGRLTKGKVLVKM